MHIQLADNRKKAILLSFNSFSEEAFNETLSDFQAECLLDFFCQSAGAFRLQSRHARQTRRSRCRILRAGRAGVNSKFSAAPALGAFCRSASRFSRRIDGLYPLVAVAQQLSSVFFFGVNSRSV